MLDKNKIDAGDLVDIAFPLRQISNRFYLMEHIISENESWGDWVNQEVAQFLTMKNAEDLKRVLIELKKCTNLFDLEPELEKILHRGTDSTVVSSYDLDEFDKEHAEN